MPRTSGFAIQSTSTTTNHASRPTRATAARRPSTLMPPSNRSAGCALIGRALIGPGRRTAAEPTASEGDPIPVQILGQPLAQLEIAGPRGPVAPGGRDLRDTVLAEGGLHRQFECQLEPSGALDRDAVEEPAGIELEVVRRVVGRDPREPVQRQACGTTHEA